jgi:hypothetical protein
MPRGSKDEACFVCEASRFLEALPLDQKGREQWLLKR